MLFKNMAIMDFTEEEFVLKISQTEKSISYIITKQQLYLQVQNIRHLKSISNPFLR